MKMWVNVHTAQGSISAVSFDLELWTLFWIAQKQCCLCGTERGRHEVLTSLCLKTQRLLSQHKRLPVDSTFYRADLMKRERAWLQILPPPPHTYIHTHLTCFHHYHLVSNELVVLRAAIFADRDGWRLIFSFFALFVYICVFFSPLYYTQILIRLNKVFV